jgi:PmbA protein
LTCAELAGRALRAAPPGEGSFVTATRERSLTLRFAASRPTQATALDDTGVELAVLRDGQVGRASTNDLSEEALAACGRRAAIAAEAAARSLGSGPYPGFPRAATARPHEGRDPGTARLDAPAGGSQLAAAFEAAGHAGAEAHGIWTAAEVEVAIASSNGAAASDSVTDAFMKVICIAPSRRSGYAARTSTRLDDLDGASLAESAAGKAMAEGDPVRLEPGEYPVVLEPAALGPLLDMLGRSAFDGLAHAEGRGALSGRLGARVAAPAVNLSDSPHYPRTLPRAFDAEGVPKAPMPLIQDGVAQAVVHDTSSAALAGAASTGHALEAGGSAAGTIPTNLVLAGGGAGDESELCAPIERGVYVTRLWYANIVRPSESLVTAVTRDGTFLIEDGRISRPLADMRLTDSVLGVLGRAQALSATPELVSDGEFYGRRFAHGVACPALRASAVRFTGAA